MWFALLWYAAPLLDSAETDIADRFRNVCVLGVVIPFALSFCGVFWGATAIACVLVAAALRFRLRRESFAWPSRGSWLAIGGVIALGWPQWIRPVLEGDSLGYHLPNAASWAQMHSVWQTTAHEWFYPGGSELFAATLYALDARWALPLCGALPALLLGSRLTIWGKALGLRSWEAALCALALIATPIAAFQIGTLQNDLWLAAFFLESLWLARGPSAVESLALTALLKPVGWMYAVISLASPGRFSSRALLAFLPLGLWLLRDVILLQHPAVAIEPAPAYWSTTIAGNLVATLSLLAQGLSYAGYAVVVFWLLPFAGLALAQLRPAAIAGSIASLLYLFLPYSFSGNVNYIAAGSSFRFTLPAMAVGALVLCALVKRARPVVLVIVAAIAAFGAYRVLGTFWNDAWTREALLIGILGGALFAFDRTRWRAMSALAALLLLIAAPRLAHVRAAGFFGDWLRSPDGSPTRAFDWIAEHRPPRIVTLSVRPGIVLLASPGTRTLEADIMQPCETAAGFAALLMVGTDLDLPVAEQSRRRQVALTCGTVVYSDGAAVLIRPR